MKPSPKRATLERQEKRKTEADGKRNQTSGGGGRQKRLNQPDTARTYKNLSTQRANLPGGRRTQGHMKKEEEGTHGDLVQKEYDASTTHAIFPSLGSMARSQINPVDGCQCSTPELRAQFNLTNDHKEKEEPHLKHVLSPILIMRMMHC